jgi:hypothetical protein
MELYLRRNSSAFNSLSDIVTLYSVGANVLLIQLLLSAFPIIRLVPDKTLWLVIRLMRKTLTPAHHEV